MKQLLKNTSLHKVIRILRDRIRAVIRAVSIRTSAPYQYIQNGKITKFRTDDPYSYGWFYPRYAKDGPHEPHATVQFINAVMSAQVVADVGANLGWFTCIAARQNKNTTVYSFELDSANCKFTKSNIAINGLTNVRLINAAVTNFDGELTYKKANSDQASPAH